MVCRVVPGRLKQIDAGAGQVVGVSDSNLIYSLEHNAWNNLPGVLKHVSVGSAGIWGINPSDEIFKLVSGNWTKVPGSLKQIDAGGDQIISGVNRADHIYCLGKDATVGFKGAGSPTPWLNIPGRLKYYSCGPIGCWGVNAHNSIYMMKGVSPAGCGGTMSWTHVPGSLSMIEVGSDGSVYGVNSAGNIYRREGVTACNPTGTLWTPVGGGRYKHVSYDLGHLWAIRQDGTILDCV
ncbi:fish-egg lectin-like [Alosa pseudoharengus]|uniref:fish-egg lectin-like n=1 Tax=Alosa pseudoharengus TaxID=34774 RepID=UPI003F8965A7